MKCLDPIQFLFNEELGAVVQVWLDCVAMVLKELESLKYSREGNRNPKYQKLNLH